MTRTSGPILALLIALFGWATVAGAEPVRVGEKLHDVFLRDLNDRLVGLYQVEGKVVVVYFWRDDCACAVELPKLAPFYEERKNDVAILAINVGQPEKVVRNYATRHDITYPMLIDNRSSAAKQYDVKGIPTVFLLDREGIVREKILGDIPSEELVELVLELL